MRRLALLLLVLLASPASAENPYTALSAPELRTRIAVVDPVHRLNWYQVEILVFARTGLPAREYWRLDRRPHLEPRNAIHPGSDGALLPENADERTRTAAALGAWQFLPAEHLILADMLARMEKNGGFRPLYHGAWVQPVRERNQAFPLYLQGGESIPLAASPLAEIMSQVEALDLPPMEMEAEDSTEPAPLFAEAPFGESGFVAPATQPEFQGMLRLHLARYLHVEPQLWFASSSAENQRFWVKIDQARRMRSDELHYLDHPLFGLLLRLTPHETAAQKELKLLTEALKAK